MDFFNPFQYFLIFTPPEKIRKYPNTKGSPMLLGGWKGHIDQKWVGKFETKYSKPLSYDETLGCHLNFNLFNHVLIRRDCLLKKGTFSRRYAISVLCFYWSCRKAYNHMAKKGITNVLYGGISYRIGRIYSKDHY